MPPIEVKQLIGGSAIESARIAGIQAQRLDGFPGSSRLEAVRMPNVSYLPSALDTGQSVQIIGDRLLPIEALAYEFTSQFARERMLARGTLELSGFTDSDIEGDVCILGNVFSRNFTHWHEELLKVVVLEREGIQCTYVISQLPAFARGLLELIGIDGSRIREVVEPTRFESVLYTTPVSYINASDYPDVLLDLRRRLVSADLGEQPDRGPRLWLDRGEQTRLGRKLVNVEEVHRLLEAYGFVRLDMGALPVRAQISAAASARVMSGLHGSQFVHSQLMPPGSHVIECFSPLYLNPTYTEIYRVLRHRYSQITNTNTPLFPDTHGGDVLVDLQQLDLALREASDRCDSLQAS